MRKRKALVLDERETSLMEKVKVVEDFLNEPLDMLEGDEEVFEKLIKIRNLPLEERRLFIVYTLLDCSILKVASLYEVDRKTVKGRIDEISKKINDYDRNQRLDSREGI